MYDQSEPEGSLFSEHVRDLLYELEDSHFHFTHWLDARAAKLVNKHPEDDSDLYTFPSAAGALNDEEWHELASALHTMIATLDDLQEKYNPS